jgi:hypothetical protein
MIRPFTTDEQASLDGLQAEVEAYPTIFDFHLFIADLYEEVGDDLTAAAHRYIAENRLSPYDWSKSPSARYEDGSPIFRSFDWYIGDGAAWRVSKECTITPALFQMIYENLVPNRRLPTDCYWVSFETRREAEVALIQAYKKLQEKPAKPLSSGPGLPTI